MRLDADHALMLGLVRQHGRPGDVADGVDAGHVGLAEPSITTQPRSILTPSFSRPRFSMLPTTPTAEIIALGGDRLRAALAVVDGGGDAVAPFSTFVDLGAGAGS